MTVITTIEDLRVLAQKRVPLKRSIENNLLIDLG